jgi:hypothetical protein
MSGGVSYFRTRSGVASYDERWLAFEARRLGSELRDLTL